MKPALWKLYKVELRRQLTVAAAFVPLGLLLLSAVTIYFTSKFAKPYDVVKMAVTANNTLVVPLAASLIAIAVVAADVKEGWLRTLLIRPITRQQYLLIKLSAVYTSILLSLLIAGVLPNILFAAFIYNGTVQWDFLRIVAIHVLFFLHAAQILALMTLLSCWIPGAFNVVVLGFWAMASAMISGFLGKFYWSEHWATILREWLYPPGFGSSIDAVAGGIQLPYADLLLGLGATAVIFALAFWSITRIQIDKGSE